MYMYMHVNIVSTCVIVTRPMQVKGVLSGGFGTYKEAGFPTITGTRVDLVINAMPS